MDEILLGKSERPVTLLAKYANRHGMVAGATGTGKTVSLMVMAEGSSRIGVPVFMADVKGDIAGLAVAGTKNEKIAKRVAEIGVEGMVETMAKQAAPSVGGKIGKQIVRGLLGGITRSR